MTKLYTKIIGTGSAVPENVIKNEHFLDSEFYDPKTGEIFDKENEEIVQKFEEITNINQRRWVDDGVVASDLAAEAGKKALEDAGISGEDLDFIIVAHNAGDVEKSVNRTAIIPGVSAHVKQKLKIKNSGSIVFDIVAGCPGWVQSMIVADMHIKSGMYKRGLVIGVDTLSPVSDPYDRDSMIFADGGGAVVVEAVESDEPVGILSHAVQSDCKVGVDFLYMGRSTNPNHDENQRYLKMLGHKVYVYALSNVPAVAKKSVERAGLDISDISKVLIHQANEKMDEAILQRLFRLYKIKEVPENVMPMTIRNLGNNSAATIPIMYDMIKKGQLENHELNAGNNIVFTSVGAGMVINAMVYKEV